ncbi:MAG: L-type lectin-domain containing protein [Cyclobacteriaceae bacterium]
MRSILISIILASSTLSLGQYRMLGTSQVMDNGCIMLTPDMPFAEGLAYNYSRLDLEKYFEIQFDVFLGDKEEGADGITFVVHNDIRGFDAYGQWGECMGYGSFNPLNIGSSINPSVAVEFDTYQNRYQNDPSCDHVAYLENGSSRHEAYWNGGDSLYNMEDNYLHDFRFRWNPSEQLIEVFWDGVKVVSQKRDLIGDIFGGETQVIWGFTASTGRKYNLQYFCLRRMVGLPIEAESDNNG